MKRAPLPSKSNASPADTSHVRDQLPKNTWQGCLCCSQGTLLSRSFLCAQIAANLLCVEEPKRLLGTAGHLSS